MIAVVSCVWKRPEKLDYTLRQIAAQSFRDFRLVLINNNAELVDFVNAAVARHSGRLPIEVIHNAENRGPYARLEQMVRLKDDFEYFVTIDDDAIFDDTLLASWWLRKDPFAVQSWNGFIFQGSYWQRIQVNAGQECHYLWGSSLMIPAAAIDSGLLHLPRRYWFGCDDLWLSFYANHEKKMKLRKADINVRIDVDGKDTYTSQLDIKPELLDLLRARGWKV